MRYRTPLQSIILCAAAILAHVFAATADPSHYTYTVSGKNATITGYTGPGGDIVIPDTLGGKPVYGIDFYAFEEIASITRITLPTNLVYIQEGAFCFCVNLVSVDVPDSLVIISSGAFSQCRSLSEIVLSTNLTTIGSAAFAGCTSLTNFTFPASLHYLGPNAFFRCTRLAGIVIPASLASIEYCAFEGCTSLANIEIPDSVKTIGFSAFDGCTSLVSLTLPASVASIGSDVFSNCTSLNSLYFVGTPPSLSWFGFYGTPATVYYLPAHAAQWPATYGNLPTALWVPSVAKVDYSGEGGHFGFTASWAADQTALVQACTNLTVPEWSTLCTTNIPASGSFDFHDSDSSSYPARFYRVTFPQ